MEGTGRDWKGLDGDGDAMRCHQAMRCCLLVSLRVGMGMGMGIRWADELGRLSRRLLRPVGNRGCFGPWIFSPWELSAASRRRPAAASSLGVALRLLEAETALGLAEAPTTKPISVNAVLFIVPRASSSPVAIRKISSVTGAII